MEDLNNSNSNRNSELIRQGIVQCLTLEAECKALKESLTESRDYSQRLEAENEELRFRILEMMEDQAEIRAEQEGLMKIMREKDSLIESYSALVSTTLDRTVHRERQDMRDIEAKVLSTLEQDLNVEMSKMAIEPEPSEPAFCLSEVTYTTKAGDTCDSLATKYSVSSAALFMGNPGIINCTNIVEGVNLCLPLQCKTFTLDKGDSCMSVAAVTGLDQGDIRSLNPWVHPLCNNLQDGTETLGRVICITPPGGKYEHDVNTTNSDPAYSEYADKAVSPPSGATLAEKTIKDCGRWYTVQKGDNCAVVLVQYHISLPLFIQANPSVSEGTCTTDLAPGRTYCVGPTKEAFAVKPQPVPPFHRFGCFAREADTKNRTVLTLAKAEHVKSMSITACQSFCLQRGWTVWGIQNGDSCFRDNQLRMDSQIINNSKCNIHCNGNTTNVCGGKDAIEVFGDQDMLRVEYASLGCYSWSKQAIRGTTGGDTIESPDEMSVDACASLCTVTKKSDFFALWEGKLCTCGREMTPGATTTSMDECNVACSGQLGDICGGKGVAEVFTTKTKNIIAS
ncbi:putative glucan 1,3-beta-glucosidase [Fusarium globosum]|uniref:Putative glucan 1,3-beta-glucosidase n=1 Tax=Fusarium globosum TaxID=78864 RepID=A0A8H6DBN5_9HYPO|nr:putative glucan 1,3-beta-glucosidase [Fusarium globosum]